MTASTDITPISAHPDQMPDTGKSFQELMRRIKAAGLLDPQPTYYTAKIIFNLLMLGLGWALVVIVGDSWWQLAVAAYMGFWYTQTGFVGHDIGHRQVTRTRRGQDILGLLHGNLLMGFSYGWWVGHHNKHHSNPNHLEKDSDITRRKAIFIPEQGAMRKGRAKQFIVRHQHVLFYPLLMTEGIGLRIESLKAIRRKLPPIDRGRSRPPHGAPPALLRSHLLHPAVLEGHCLHSGHEPVVRVVYRISFRSQSQRHAHRAAGDNWDWMTRQVITSRNIRSSYLTDFLYGGLNYQVEHHLFPTMPRKSLRHARPITIEFCKEIGLKYHETSVWRSYVEVIVHLYRTKRRTGRPQGGGVAPSCRRACSAARPRTAFGGPY